MRCLIYILFFLLPFVGFNQNYADKDYYLLDSLDLDALSQDDKKIIESSLKDYHKSKDDTSKIIALNGICENMMDDAWHKYQFYQYEIIKKSLAAHPSPAVEKSLFFSLAFALNNIGYIHKDHGDMALALEYYHKSLKVQNKVGDKQGIGAILNNIGGIYNGQGDTTLALEYYHKSLKIREEILDNDGIANSLNNIAHIYQSQGKSNLALEYYHRGLKLQEEIANKHGIANSLNNLGVAYHKNGNIPLALEYYQKSLDLQEEIGYKQGVITSSNNLGDFYRIQGNIPKALEYAKKSLAISQEIGYPLMIQKTAELLVIIYKQEGNYKEELSMYKLYIQMRDSMKNEATQKAAVQQQAKYEYEKQKAVDDAEHDKQIAIEQEAKAKQQVITYATAGGLGLVVIFLVFVFNRLQVTKKQKLVIETQKVEVEQQKEVVELAHHELEEKNREIMDSITYAKRIQNAILPQLKVVKEYLQESFILYKPKDIVAGDFYWMEHKEGKVLFAAADCTGHGVPGAMVSVVCNNGLNRSVREYGLTNPGEILNKTREIVIAEFEKSEDEVKDGMDIALCSLEGTTLKYAGANNPLWIIRNNEIIETKADKQPIGQFENPTPYKTHAFELQKGDSIYVFSDGYVDQFGGDKGKKFKAAAFRTLLLSIQDKSMEEQQTIINTAFEDWKGNLEQIDDVCIIGVKII